MPKVTEDDIASQKWMASGSVIVMGLSENLLIPLDTGAELLALLQSCMTNSSFTSASWHTASVWMMGGCLCKTRRIMLGLWRTSHVY